MSAPGGPMSSTPLPLVFGDYALEDRYRLDKGRVYLTGIQALVRLPMMQRQRDLAAGPQHRRLHLAAIAARRSAATTRRCGRRKRYLKEQQHRLPARPQRGPRRDRGVGHAADQPLSRAPRSTACSASGTARARASTARATCSSTPMPPAPRSMAACSRSPATTTLPSPRPCRTRASRSSPRR